MKKLMRSLFTIVILCCLVFEGCSFDKEQSDHSVEKTDGLIRIDNIPEYSGNAYIVIENNNPSFNKDDLTTISFETYSELDKFGRCGVAYANAGRDLMPTEKRGGIGQVKPSGWQTVKYDNVDGNYLYNRCHLIGYQLTAENANKKNLITGTRYLNIEGMLPFENMLADYVKETENHVLYRVTPIFEGDNLVASGVQMEGYSIEDKGAGICFNVYAYNIQPEIKIDYATGKSYPFDTMPRVNAAAKGLVEIRGNSNSMIYHGPKQSAYEEMADSKHLVIFHSEQEAIDAGYRKAKR